MKCGYVALLGRPNAGKSTLLNALLGAKISVVSAKPQTTRNRILGVFTEGEVQLVFLDTPGIHKAEGLPRINKAMNKVAWGVLEDADVVCYLVDVERGWHEEDGFYLSGILEKSKKPLVLLASKSDRLKKEEYREVVDQISEKFEALLDECSDPAVLAERRNRLRLQTPCPISAKKPEDVVLLRAALAAEMPEHPWLFEEDALTDLPQQFICGELIREQVFRQMGQELPYSCGIKVDKFERKPGIINLMATLVVQKESHKAMLIGKGGSRIKSIGIEARKSLEKHLESKVYLEMFVKVQDNWLDSATLIAEYAGLKE